MSADAPERILYGLAPMLYDGTKGISTILVNELRMAGFPDLQDGRIMFGERGLTTRKAPPSIVCVWEGSDAAGAEWGREAVPEGGRAVQPVLNALAADVLRLAFYCWAEAYPPDPDAVKDADAARYLAHQLWRVLHRTSEGAYRVMSLDTTADRPTEAGFQVVLRAQVRSVVPDNLLAYVLPGTRAILSVSAGGGNPVNIPTPGVT
jgi:hypothetical protein